MEVFVLIMPNALSVEQLSSELSRAFQNFAWVEDNHIVLGEDKKGELVHLRLRLKEVNFRNETLRDRISHAHDGIGDFQIFYKR